MAIQIYVMTHKPFLPPDDPMYLPLHVGRANAASLGFPGDDTGDSISSENAFFCELTGMYWLWKNCSNLDFIGICHYRRYLINENGSIFTKSQLEPLLRDYDMITSKLLALTCSYYEGFGQNHNIQDLIAARDVLKEKYPACLDTFDALVHGNHTYFGNILITSKKQYDRYCAWLFDILFEVKKRTDFTGYNDYAKRLFGFLSEFLQTVWIHYHKLHVLECKVGMMGEKYETKQLKQQLAAFFKQRDYVSAGSCFMETYQKRPDVLMEASDVTGELRLCMQIISTCSYEDERFHRCILDDIQDYDGLILHFCRLNQAVRHFLADAPTEEDLAFLKENKTITQVSADIALLLFEKNETIRQKTAKKIAKYI